MRVGNRFADTLREYVAGHDVRQLAIAARVHRATLYTWTSGSDIPGDVSKVRAIARALKLSPQQEEDLVEKAALARREREASKLVSAISEMAEHEPDSLTYDPDLEDADVQGLLAQVNPADRDELLRIFRAVITEKRRRH